MFDIIWFPHSLVTGLTTKDTDEVKGIFFDTNFYVLLMTLLVSGFHVSFSEMSGYSNHRFLLLVSLCCGSYHTGPFQITPCHLILLFCDWSAIS